MENHKRRLPPFLPLLIAAEQLGLGRTRAYRAAALGEIPTVQGWPGSLKLVETAWLLDQLPYTEDELAERLPEAAWSPPRKRKKGGLRQEAVAS